MSVKIDITLRSRTELSVLVNALAMFVDMAQDGGREVATLAELAAAQALLERLEGGKS